MIWVFDLDNTLYHTDNFNGEYDSIIKDDYLFCLLNQLQGKKYVFTNATLYHAKMILYKMGIIHLFTDIIDRYKMDSFKPKKKAFEYFITEIGLKNNNNETVIFFEDSIINLLEAKKKYDWVTVLIMPKIKNKNIKLIDYIYNDIHSAVESFSFNPGKCHNLL
tara:strand:+ start:3152 stop:3640 length:489 start_codon:yes stop_codon:yes gene_type:complete